MCDPNMLNPSYISHGSPSGCCLRLLPTDAFLTHTLVFVCAGTCSVDPVAIAAITPVARRHMHLDWRTVSGVVQGLLQACYMEAGAAAGLCRMMPPVPQLMHWHGADGSGVFWGRPTGTWSWVLHRVRMLACLCTAFRLIYCHRLGVLLSITAMQGMHQRELMTISGFLPAAALLSLC